MGRAVGSVLFTGGGVIVGGPAHTHGANPDPDLDGEGDDEGDDNDEWANAV